MAGETDGGQPGQEAGDGHPESTHNSAFADSSAPDSSSRAADSHRGSLWMSMGLGFHSNDDSRRRRMSKKRESIELASLECK
uniref:Calcium/calmodulin-dependent 3',5'-cyclic nucleotide phosphodiesterase 1C n=1 Tax=Heterorhabditis bacteriophora TaxID=37862 RepID=A0A1I7WTE5_HETBA